MKELWKKDTINPEKGQEPPLDQRSNTSREDLVLTRSTVTPIIVGLHLWNWIPLNNVKRRTLGESKVTNLRKRAIHVANRATSQEIVDHGTW